ncbi:MAG: alpha-L-fucosidase [Verrucomicrobiota bacterium]|nr:alpha-L-fucosidase [Verrucomicrobiota bacterium]
MKKTALTLATGLVLSVCATPAVGQKYEPNWKSLDSRPIPGWFDDAKFGIFIHWGVYSVPAWGAKGSYAEWYWDAMQNKNGATWKFHVQHYGEQFKYQDFAPKFTAELFEPDQWADLFVRAGARYVVLTSKHHEGFCLWPNADSWNWNSVDQGPHRDLCGDLAKAVRARGLKMGFYYSLYEWFNPVYQMDFPRFVREHFHPQFKDLVNRYQPSLIFADGEWAHSSSEWKSEELLAWLFNESPGRDEVVIDDRWGKDTRSRHGGYFTTEYGEVGGDTKLNADRKFEECRAIGASFGYNRNETIDDYQSAYGLVCLLVNLVAKGGNLLLDIGPTADGRIPVIMQQRLVEMGDWLRVNGEAIYGTQPWKVHGEGPTQPAKGHAAERTQVFQPSDIRFTTKAGAIYAMCLALPTGSIRITSLGRSTAPTAGGIRSVGLLGSDEKLTWSQEADALVVQCPRSFSSRHAITLKVEVNP